MNKRDHLYLGCFLNRTATYCKCNPLMADPIRVLKDHFDFDEPKGNVEAFDDFCFAALKDHYDWKNGSPGNGSYYGEKLELLVEAAYLIHNKSRKYRLKKQRSTTISIKYIPMLLTAAEFDNPLLFFERFFNCRTLLHWKKIVASFTNACISNFSVADEVEMPEVLHFYTNTQKLFYATSRLVELLKKELNE